MNQSLFLALVSLGAAVAACERANPDVSTPDMIAGDPGGPGMLGDASADSRDGGKPAAMAGPGAYRGGSFLPASTPSEANECITVDPSEYDTSCTSDADCMSASTGSVCPSGCQGACPNGAINVKGKAHYEEAVTPMSRFTAKCGCAVEDSEVACINSVCTYCPHGCGAKTRWQTF